MLDDVQLQENALEDGGRRRGRTASADACNLPSPRTDTPVGWRNPDALTRGESQSFTVECYGDTSPGTRLLPGPARRHRATPFAKCHTTENSRRCGVKLGSRMISPDQRLSTPTLFLCRWPVRKGCVSFARSSTISTPLNPNVAAGRSAPPNRRVVRDSSVHLLAIPGNLKWSFPSLRLTPRNGLPPQRQEWLRGQEIDVE